ncbi:hypothetical protein ACIRD8_35090 [Streptomyces sp. NPDC102451]|uniref:hypothetical protein n=1 Tax=Streptomyces sp. NPDC102451 TaxID=3366177 RepID=UPI00381D7DE3
MEHWIVFWTALWVGSSKVTRWTVDWLCNAKPKPAPKPAEEPADGTGESSEGPKADPGEKPKTPTQKVPSAEGSALLRWFVVAALAVITKATPYTTTIALVLVAAWVLTALVLGYAAALPEKAPADGEEKPDEEPATDQRHPSEILTREHVALLLAEVYTEGSGVHLATLAEHLTRTPLVGLPATPWKTGDVRALLTRHGVRVRPGVRVPPTGGREGVHQEDFPPLPQPPSEPPVVGVVVPGQSNNNNAGNAPRFTVTDDPHNPAQAHVHHHERA